MGAHNICLCKEADKKYTACNLKTTELLECALIGVCAVIRLNKVKQDEGLLNLFYFAYLSDILIFSRLQFIVLSINMKHP